MTVIDYINKYNINENDVEIYIMELDDIEWRSTYKYFDDEVINVYPHNGAVVFQVEKAR